MTDRILVSFLSDGYVIVTDIMHPSLVPHIGEYVEYDVSGTFFMGTVTKVIRRFTVDGRRVDIRIERD